MIEAQSTLTLATAADTGPWSAPVYYLFLEGRFYFFSTTHSRHIKQAMGAGSRAAASLFDQAPSWQAIRGIQMSGMIEQIRSWPLSLKVIAAYLHRFPFTREFFPDGSAPDPDMFFSRFRARLFAFTPIEVHYIDNRLGFGTRQQIDW